MVREIEIGGRKIGDGHPTYIVAEIGINHNGNLDIAKEMVRSAKETGADAVKFQKRTIELCVPKEQRDIMRETPWGYISYMEYRSRVEFGKEDYEKIDQLCRELEIDWFASVWDEPSVDFMEQFNPVCYKMASASLTDHSLLKKVRKIGRPMIVSSGMSTFDQIQEAIQTIGQENLLLAHSTSSYPCDPQELNLRMVETLRERFECPIGYSGHEVGLITSVVAVALGACMVERHFTLDRAMWGSDQSASVEPGGFRRLVKYIRVTEMAVGDGKKHVYDSEKSSLKKLRRYL
jgi:N-acetylneuraminate synthase